MTYKGYEIRRCESWSGSYYHGLQWRKGRRYRTYIIRKDGRTIDRTLTLAAAKRMISTW